MAQGRISTNCEKMIAAARMILAGDTLTGFDESRVSGVMEDIRSAAAHTGLPGELMALLYITSLGNEYAESNYLAFEVAKQMN